MKFITFSVIALLEFIGVFKTDFSRAKISVSSLCSIESFFIGQPTNQAKPASHSVSTQNVNRSFDLDERQQLTNENSNDTFYRLSCFFCCLRVGKMCATLQRKHKVFHCTSQRLRISRVSNEKQKSFRTERASWPFSWSDFYCKLYFVMCQK